MSVFKGFARRLLGHEAPFVASAESPAAVQQELAPRGTEPAPLDGASEGLPAAPRRLLPAGLMDQPPLREFLDGPHFGLGRHNGSNFRTADARDRGVRVLVAEFQHLVLALGERKQAQIDGLHDALLQAEGVCEETARRLRNRVQQCERERATLHAQLELAQQGLGWVQKPIASYQLGFAQGLKEAMDAEHLGF